MFSKAANKRIHEQRCTNIQGLGRINKLRISPNITLIIKESLLAYQLIRFMSKDAQIFKDLADSPYKMVCESAN